ncbi:hypothetical protein [Marmoricola sp. URHB0036]|uniref:hypothetical protein n=1 Tax=Marmoricola sp. URHB0036 TaxID=1298863 RepID=UPI0004009799|nr:hypothetical protein [Marmoricola sp. URHB0036]
MTGAGPRDLTALHRRILDAKGGTFGAVSVQPDASSAVDRSFRRRRSRSRLGSLVQRAAARAGRLGRR